MGEAGYSRLCSRGPVRMPDPEDHCGMDVTPADGIGFTFGENANVPPTSKVYRTSGVCLTSVFLGRPLSVISFNNGFAQGFARCLLSFASNQRFRQRIFQLAVRRSLDDARS
jgi:hypothetical protein